MDSWALQTLEKSATVKSERSGIWEQWYKAMYTTGQKFGVSTVFYMNTLFSKSAFNWTLFKEIVTKINFK